MSDVEKYVINLQKKELNVNVFSSLSSFSYVWNLRTNTSEMDGFL